MRLKKTISVTLFLLCILTIGAVSAASDTDTNVISNDENQETHNTNDITTSNKDTGNSNEVLESTEEELHSAPDDGTFTSLQNKIDNAEAGSTISLENDYKIRNDFNYGAGVNINKSLTINGNNHILDGLSESGIFKIDTDSVGESKVDIRVILNNIKFSNGFIYSGYHVDLVVNNCIFNNNQHGAGGAIYSEGNLTVKGSVFNNNYASENDGGAIYIKGDLLVQNCVFNNNQALRGDGGAIFVRGNSKIINSSFTSNNARGSGGAIFTKCFYNTRDDVTWVDPRYDNDINFPTYYYTSIIEGSSFTNNLAGGYFDKGDNIFWYNGDVTADCKGGAIYAQQYDKAGGYYAQIVKCTFTNNKKHDTITGETKYNDLDGNYNAVACTFKSKSTTPTSSSSSNNAIKLTLKKVKVKKSAKKLVLTATLKKGKTALKKKWLKFKFNGKKYKTKTNNKGIAKVTINKKLLKKLKVGKKVKYQVSYGKTTIKRTVKVLK